MYPAHSYLLFCQFGRGFILGQSPYTAATFCQSKFLPLLVCYSFSL